MLNLKISVLIATLLLSAVAHSAGETELGKVRNQFYAEEAALTQEWNKKANHPGVDQEKLRREMKAKLSALRKHYVNKDPRGPYLDSIDKKLGALDGGGMTTESTGGSTNKKPKHIGADVDLKLTNMDGGDVSPGRVNQGLEVIIEDAKQRGHTVNSNAARVDVVDQEVTGWRSASPEGKAVTANDPDANVTPGGLHATRNPGELRDEQGAYKDLRSKYETARANCDLKTMGKCVAKGADNQGNTRPRIVEGTDGKPTFDLQEGNDAKGNPSYEIPRDPKSGSTNTELVDKARSLQNYETTNEAGITTPGVGKQANQMEIESTINDMDTQMDQIGEKATKKGELRQVVRENFAASHDNAALTGSGEAGKRTRYNPATGKYEEGHGGQQIREEIDSIRTANSEVVENKINPGKKVPTGTDPYTGGNRPTAEAGAELFSDPDLKSSLEQAGAKAVGASADVEGRVTTIETPDSVRSSTEAPDSNLNSGNLFDGGRSSFTAPTARESLNNLPTNIDDMAEAGMQRLTGESMDHGGESSEIGGKAATALSAANTAGNAVSAINNRNEANQATAKADAANQAYQEALEAGNLNEAVRQNQQEFSSRVKADNKNTAATNAAVGATGGMIDLANGLRGVPSQALSAGGAALGAASDGYQVGNAVGKAEIARRSAARASQHAEKLRARGLDRQAERYDQIAADQNEIMLSEAENAAGGAIKTGVGIIAASGSAAAGAGLGAYALTRLGIENTKAGRALEDAKAGLGARVMEYFGGSPEINQELEERSGRIQQLQEGLADGTYVVPEDFDKDDIDGAIDRAISSGNFREVTSMLERKGPLESSVVASNEPGTEGGLEGAHVNILIPEGDGGLSSDAETGVFELPGDYEGAVPENDGVYELPGNYREVGPITGGNAGESAETNPSGRVYELPGDYGGISMAEAMSGGVVAEMTELGTNSFGRQDNTAFTTNQERNAAGQMEHARQSGLIANQGRSVDQNIHSSQRQHESGMRTLQGELQRRAASREAIAGGFSQGLNQGVYGAGRRLGEAVGGTIYEPRRGGCGSGSGCGGYGHDEGNGSSKPRGQSTATNDSGNNAGGSGTGGNTPGCDKASQMMDELFALQRKFLSSNGKVSVQPRHDQLVNGINAPLRQCSSESPEKSLALGQRFQNSPLAQASGG